ncbi:Rne/Rng family ribonuclease [Hyphobacterium sp. HN65]|uniref:Ribonuclease E n=1 Tax=Hyphobacterium lacteum TaxID=3116575 RepID=A0ABU7LLL9_9PROT|nr:Rne/Rng family ribonuclease [Hyphobacterium sp. HN65]MEE2524816.1 Rne/Rng family ribonuclease [Hyphobacterium sp. HN65]
MSKKMLIDASHSEETRVAIVEGNRVEEFDFESASKKPIRGNIYLAKVTRVEPSLQAAFVEYGGNRHGFLAFNEIHPDYYQIPHEDRLELQAEEEKAVEEAVAEAEAAGPDAEDSDEQGEDDTDAEMEAVARKRRQFFRKYKIQEVIKRRQILLVQVAKEERGNKGAALTTYLSLAGRYCVLMPNTPRGGGISRKISNGGDRKRLKEIVSELELPTGMGLIVRTAGASRTKAEIRRDHDYLRRVWDDIRSKTLESVAPALVYEEGDLVRRAIRDMYDRDVEIVLVEGEGGYKDAKNFMKLLMPSHASKVQQYKEPMPLFVRHHVEDQLEATYNAETQLKSGGYLVIHQTEALVAIDVNSGRATRERNIEDTALKTNLEAADEAARQMRLRDLAGLVVIDFIDMEENRNIRAVEKRMKDALKKDRARLQMGRISQFGLMEISRQRRRTSILEGSTRTCPHCGGKGYQRTPQSSSLVALRALEEEGARKRAARVRINVPTDVALYLLNEKRDHVLALEERYEFRVLISADPDLIPPDFRVDILETRDSGNSDDAEAVAETPVSPEDVKPDDAGNSSRRRRRRRRRKDEDADASGEAETSTDDEGEDENRGTRSGEDDEDAAPRKRRRRGRRGGRGRRRNRNTEAGENSENAESAESGSDNETPEGMQVIDPEAAAEDLPAPDAEAEAEKPKRRSRRKKAEPKVDTDAKAETPVAQDKPEETAEAEEKPKRKRAPRKKAEPKTEPKAETEDKPEEPGAEEKPKRKRTARKKAAEAAPAEEAKPAEEAEAKAEEKPKRTRRKKSDDDAKAADTAETDSGEAADDKPKRTGWWQRGGKLFGGK